MRAEVAVVENQSRRHVTTTIRIENVEDSRVEKIWTILSEIAENSFDLGQCLR